MRILFLGEGPLDGPARYLAAVLRYARLPFDHRPDRRRLPSAWRRRRFAAVVLSDYRASAFDAAARRWLVERVREGAGLLMIGGWASFTGLVGGYAGTAVEALLPVRCRRGDDRVNCASGSLVVRGEAHPVRAGLSFDDAPVVCGYHRTRLRPGSRVVLALRDLRVSGERASLGAPHPLLVLGPSETRRTAAFLSDCAPHWAGGLVDWGTRRIRVLVSRGNVVEVGNFYLRFFERLIRWTAGASLTPLK